MTLWDGVQVGVTGLARKKTVVMEERTRSVIVGSREPECCVVVFVKLEGTKLAGNKGRIILTTSFKLEKKRSVVLEC